MFASLPLTALRAFESASRLLSFAAAQELSVTPMAVVSHQIRSLETWLGVPLFERLPRQVRLTEGGERLFHSLHGAFWTWRKRRHLAPATQWRQPGRSPPPAAFAALWRKPRLGRFLCASPHHQPAPGYPLRSHRLASGRQCRSGAALQPRHLPEPVWAVPVR